MTLYVSTDPAIISLMASQPEISESQLKLIDPHGLDAPDQLHEFVTPHVARRTGVPVIALVLESREDITPRAVARVVCKGRASLLDHFALGHLEATESIETPMAAIISAALSVLPSHHVLALEGPRAELVIDAPRAAAKLRAMLDWAKRKQQPAHVASALRLSEQLAGRYRLSTTQQRLLENSVRSAAVRLGAVPATLAEQLEAIVDSAPRSSTKQARNSWLREVMRQIDESGRPAV